MATIREDYVSFETAKLLKEKSFDGQYHMYYVEDGKYTCSDLHDIKDYAKSIVEFDYLHRTKVPAPTQQMAMKWLRKEHNKFIEICMDRAHNFKDIVFRPAIYDRELACLWESDNFLTYEEACEAAIKYCLENLI